ncbi:hypothetical protein SEVIR_3G349050v4 [Setaria viridis]|uniref:uncharacterized protein n=1 Tax=Setaria viridis TaxID=4556 RepID=UPI001493AB9B|nr:uncharacterized protein LOC117848677 isoform X3 [Setaria viridis]
MVPFVPALAHNVMQPTQIAQNYSGNDIRVCCTIPEQIADEAQDKMADEVVQPMMVSEVGMAFESKDKAYEIYNTYGGKIGFVLERAIQSDEEIELYVRNIWFAVMKVIEKLSHQGILQGRIAMLVFSLVSVKRGFG